MFHSAKKSPRRVARSGVDRKDRGDASPLGEMLSGESAASPASAFWITDFAFERFVYVSRGFEKVWGRSCDCLYRRPRSFFDTIHPADRARVEQHYARQRQGVTLDQEYRILRPDGSIRWVWDRRSPVGDTSEQVYAGVALDITDRKQAEQMSRRDSSVVQSSNEAIITTNLEGVITAWNPAAEALFGFAAHEAIGASIMLIVPPDRAADEVRRLDRVARGENVGTIEVSRRRRDGSAIEVAMSVSGLRENAATVTGTVVICRDITSEKAARSALLESERCFRETFDAAPIGLAHAAVDGRLVRVNRALCAMTGYSREALLQVTLAQLAEPDDREIDAVQLQDLIAGKTETYRVEKRLQRRNDFPLGVELTVTARSRHEGMPGYLLVTVQDITARQELALQLRQAQKLETIGQLAGGMAHDFNNVLGYVTMRAELTCTYPNLPANVLADLHQIKAAANRATHLTRQLLAFSRNEAATRPQRIDINELIGATVKMVQRLLGEDLTLEVGLPPEPIVVHLDPGIVDQVVLNLALNARDAMPNGGTLTIATTAFEVPDRESRPSPEIAPGPYVCIRVSDTGTGIAPENMPRIFEPFFTTKQPGRGTGLGLAMVQSLVRQNHGWVTVESAVGRGTTFRVYLPAVDASTLATIAEAPRPPAAGGNETILLVEDEADLRITARTLLQFRGYHVIEAATGAEALDLWEKQRDEIAVIFTDMVLPDGVSGRALATRAQADKPDVRVVFTTGYSPEIAGRELTLEDGQNFLPKPYSADQLFAVIRQTLNA